MKTQLKTVHLLCAVWTTVGLAAGCGSPSDPAESAYATELAFSYTDESRQREIPVRVYLPADKPGPYPVILFSPGTGDTRDHYTTLGRAWARAGLAGVFVTHPDTDQRTIYGASDYIPDIIRAVLNAVAQPTVRQDHPLDMSFVLDELAHDPELSARLDVARVAVGGHSLGAYTALILVGLRAEGLPDLADSRFHAALALSPPGVGVLGLAADAAAGIAAPCMTMTGALDLDPLTLNVRNRVEIFDQSNGPGQYLLTLAWGTHAVYDDKSPWVPDRLTFPHYRDTIETATTLFFAAYLQHDAAAQTRLLNHDLPTQAGWGAALDYKNVTPVGSPAE